MFKKIKQLKNTKKKFKETKMKDVETASYSLYKQWLHEGLVMENYTSSFFLLFNREPRD